MFLRFKRCSTRLTPLMWYLQIFVTLELLVVSIALMTEPIGQARIFYFFYCDVGIWKGDTVSNKSPWAML